MLHMIIACAITMEYVIPPIMENSVIKVEDEKILRVSKHVKARKSIPNDVVFAEKIRSELHSCVWRMELKIPMNEGGGFW